MPRPILLGICGDSAAGKTTLTRGLVRILGEAQVTHIDGDHYHRYTRAQRAELGVTPLHPDANHLDILEQHLVHLRAGEPILKPVYRHRDGSPGPGRARHAGPVHDRRGDARLPHRRRCATPTTCGSSWTRPRTCAARWKVQRDCSRRGYTTDEVLAELDRREADAETFIRPQRRYADIVISFMPGDRGDPDAPRRQARHATRAGPPRPARADRRRQRHPDGPARLRDAAVDPRDDRPGAQRRLRGGDLGPPALRQPPAHRPAGRVHGRDRAAPLRAAGGHPAARPLPAGDRAGGGGARGQRRPRRRRPAPSARPAPPRRPSSARRWASSSSTTGRDGPTDERSTYQGRLRGASRSGISPSWPPASSTSTAARDSSEIPSPARAACLIAPLDPSSSMRGASPRSARNCSLSARVPDPGSRSSHGASGELGGRVWLAERRRVLGRGDAGDPRSRSAARRAAARRPAACRRWRRRRCGAAPTRSRARGCRRRG